MRKPRPARDIFLHDEIERILRRTRRPMRAPEIADAINHAGNYAKRDGSMMRANQVHARVSKHAELFERTPAGVQLRAR